MDHFRFLCPNGTSLRNIPLEERGGPPEAEDEGAYPFSLLGGLNQRVESLRLALDFAPHQVGIVYSSEAVVVDTPWHC